MTDEQIWFFTSVLSQNINLVTDAHNQPDKNGNPPDPKTLATPEQHAAQLLGYENEKALKSYFQFINPLGGNPDFKDLLSAIDCFKQDKGDLVVNLTHVSRNKVLTKVNEMVISIDDNLVDAVKQHQKKNKVQRAQGQSLHDHIFKEGEGNIALAVPLIEMMYNAIKNDKESIYAMIYIGNEILSLKVLRDCFHGVLSTVRNGKDDPVEWCLEFLPSIAAVIVAQICPTDSGISEKNVLLVKAFIHWLAIIFHFTEKSHSHDNSPKVLITIVDQAIQSSYAYINYKSGKKVMQGERVAVDSSDDEIDGVKIPNEQKIERIVNLLLTLADLHKMDVDSFISLLNALGSVTTGKFREVLNLIKEHEGVLKAFGKNPKAMMKAVEKEAEAAAENAIPGVGDWHPKKMFKKFDKDNCGHLDQHEFQEALKSMGLHLSHEKILEVFTKVDKNHTNQINYESFKEAMGILKM